MRLFWTLQKEHMPHVTTVIDAGLAKLAQYETSMSVVLAYILATGTSCLFIHIFN